MSCPPSLDMNYSLLATLSALSNSNNNLNSLVNNNVNLNALALLHNLLSSQPSPPAAAPAAVAAATPSVVSSVLQPTLATAVGTAYRAVRACNHCKASKTRCDYGRPCSRCVKTNKASTCRDLVNHNVRKQNSDQQSSSSSAASTINIAAHSMNINTNQIDSSPAAKKLRSSKEESNGCSINGNNNNGSAVNTAVADPAHLLTYISLQTLIDLEHIPFPAPNDRAPITSNSTPDNTPTQSQSSQSELIRSASAKWPLRHCILLSNIAKKVSLALSILTAAFHNNSMPLIEQTQKLTTACKYFDLLLSNIMTALLTPSSTTCNSKKPTIASENTAFTALPATKPLFPVALDIHHAQVIEQAGLFCLLDDALLSPLTLQFTQQQHNPPPYCSNAFAALLLYNSTELMRENPNILTLFNRLLHPSDVDSTVEIILNSLMRGEQHFQYVAHWKCRDQQFIRLSAVGNLHYNAAGWPTALIQTFRRY
jgi:hypothetical protein